MKTRLEDLQRFSEDPQNRQWHVFIDYASLKRPNWRKLRAVAHRSAAFVKYDAFGGSVCIDAPQNAWKDFVPRELEMLPLKRLVYWGTFQLIQCHLRYANNTNWLDKKNKFRMSNPLICTRPVLIQTDLFHHYHDGQKQEISRDMEMKLHGYGWFHSLEDDADHTEAHHQQWDKSTLT